jgi:phosphate-selective porin
MEYPTDQGTFTASAAYMDFSTDNAINEDPDPALPPTSELDGYYAKAGYLLPDKVGIGRLQFFARYEDLDYGVDTGYYTNTWTSAGANYYINGQQLKVTFEYATVDYDRQHPTIQSLRDHDQVTLGLQLIF